MKELAYSKSVGEIVQELRVNLSLGLSSAEAAGRLAEHGPNEIATAVGRLL